jgi:glutamate/tyrosine decarboxylase-like PLP-dependent enzyme
MNKNIIVGNITIKQAAKIMNKSEMFIRIGLQRGSLKFGTAEKISSKYSYHISPMKFCEYMGIDLEELYVRINRNIVK